ncbi:Alpha beta hydrolase fold protein [Lasiodiplodia theobromae]|uniref:Alpha beta hydrolase fold protein n=1 Tax=Lasiodiplodia theobromae TaxID=45133 RepID=UPI0015C3DA28|nr:Alpha beta hydrolase fold protein [Lasiodiplodia theobromae]KAF4538877.1 Alpha beta hydrolase fold protein [Lasiodiplodia theobromae]
MAESTTAAAAAAEQPAFTPLPRRTVTLANPSTNTTITASYAASFPGDKPDPAKPTIVFFHSFTSDSSLFAPQFADPRLKDSYNLIAVDLLGHGGTRIYASSEGVEDETERERLQRDQWTYWDSAWMTVGLVRELGVKKFFVGGTSQGGWVAVRVALVAPEMVLGVVPMGTSIDHESPRSMELGCWDGRAVAFGGPIAFTTSATATPDFAPPDQYCDYLLSVGIGAARLSPEASRYWTARIKQNYAGDAGRRRMRTAAVNLAERDGLGARVEEVRCPVLWLHGDKDEVYSVRNAEEGIKAFGGGEEKKLVVVKEGSHFLSASNFGEVNGLIDEFVKKWWKGAEA